MLWTIHKPWFPPCIPTPYFHFQAYFPTIFPSIFSYPWYGAFQLLWHVVLFIHLPIPHHFGSLISFHHSFHPSIFHPSNLVTSHPYIMPWISLFIGLNLLYLASFHIKFNPSIQIHSTKFIYPLIQSISPSLNPLISNSFILYSTQFPSYQNHSSNLLQVHSSNCISIQSIHQNLHKIKKSKNTNTYKW